MKLNFWQWIGLVLIILGVAAVIYRETMQTKGPASTPSTRITRE